MTTDHDPDDAIDAEVVDESNEEPDVQFAEILLALDRGRVHSRMGDRLRELVEAVESTGRKGTLALKLSVSKSKAHGQIEVAAQIDMKTPKPDDAVSIFFAHGGGNLTRNDPNQYSLTHWQDN